MPKTKEPATSAEPQPGIVPAELIALCGRLNEAIGLLGAANLRENKAESRAQWAEASVHHLTEALRRLLEQVPAEVDGEKGANIVQLPVCRGAIRQAQQALRDYGKKA